MGGHMSYCKCYSANKIKCKYCKEKYCGKCESYKYTNHKLIKHITHVKVKCIS